MNIIKRFLHDKLGWVFSPILREIDNYGFQDTYTCEFCGDKVLPSSGGYFHSTRIKSGGLE